MHDDMRICAAVSSTALCVRQRSPPQSGTIRKCERDIRQTMTCRRQKHESLHIMQPMQQCGVCPSKFYRASMLEFHMLQEHDTLADLDQFDIVAK